LLPIGDRAILEIVVRQLQSYGFSELTFAVGYLAHLIRAVFDDGSDLEVSIEYHQESEPRGTAGALATIDRMEDSFLVMNGDVLTSLDYNLLFDAHRKLHDDRLPPACGQDGLWGATRIRIGGRHRRGGCVRGEA
jgi:NDP-sugar pyrophosphorylase family protein